MPRCGLRSCLYERHAIVSDLERVASWLSEARNAYAFTGAGISTESGIPDFRTPGGVWSKYQPVYYEDFMSSREARCEYWRQKCEAHAEFADAKPNRGHEILATWEQTEDLRGVITQNIDGLHQLAGSQQVLEVHGTAREAACMHCGDRMPVEGLVADFNATGEAPDCKHCGGPMKHATISFGQALDESVITEAAKWMQSADLVLALGSSLVVHPAAGLPQRAVESGARLVIINLQPTPLDHFAEAVIREPLGETLARVSEYLTSDI